MRGVNKAIARMGLRPISPPSVAFTYQAYLELCIGKISQALSGCRCLVLGRTRQSEVRLSEARREHSSDVDNNKGKCVTVLSTKRCQILHRQL